MDQSACFKVIIIESPSSSDLFDGRFAGRILVESLALFDIPARLRLVIDMNALVRAIQHDVGEMIRVHISQRAVARGQARK